MGRRQAGPGPRRNGEPWRVSKKKVAGSDLRRKKIVLTALGGGRCWKQGSSQGAVAITPGQQTRAQRKVVETDEEAEA